MATEAWSKGVLREDGEPLFSFDTDNGEFARGFEAGGIFMQLAVRPTEFEADFQVGNTIMIKRMAEAVGRAYSIEEIDQHIMRISVAAKGAPA